MREHALQQFREGTVIPAFPLTLHADRSFAPQRQRALIRYYLDAGVGGLAVAVHTTQFAIRDPKIGLFEPVLRIGAEEADAFEAKTGRTVIKIAGVCGPVEQAVREAELARSLGYDMVLLSTGGLNHLSEEDLLRRAEKIGEIIPFLGFYLQTAVGGRVFSYDYWRTLCENPAMVGIKAAPFNRYLTQDVVRAAATSSRADDISLYTGNDDNIVIDLLTRYRFEENGKTYEKRFVGGLLGHWSLWTHKVVELFGQIKTAATQDSVPMELLQLANQITDCNAAVFDSAHNFAGVIPGVHEVLRRQGLMEGIWTLDPHETLSPGQSEEIDRVYRMYPHLNDDAFVRENLSRWLQEDR